MNKVEPSIAAIRILRLALAHILNGILRILLISSFSGSHVPLVPTTNGMTLPIEIYFRILLSAAFLRLLSSSKGQDTSITNRVEEVIRMSGIRLFILYLYV